MKKNLYLLILIIVFMNGGILLSYELKNDLFLAFNYVGIGILGWYWDE